MRKIEVWIAVFGLVVAMVASAAGQGEEPEGAEGLSLWTWKIAMVPGFEAVGELLEQATGHSVTVEA
ncbi:MAG: hypothetical protein ACOCZB_04300 [Spirochaetota bacterium]